MITASGKVIDINNINYDDISLHDLCVSLENINRFCGATNPLLPVAWHCVELSKLFTDRKLKLQALFHEMDEPFISDIPSQVKDKFPEIRKFGHKVCKQVAAKYNVLESIDDPYVSVIDIVDFDHEVKKWDKLLGDYESYIFFDRAGMIEYGNRISTVCYKDMDWGYTPGTLLQEITKCL